MAARPWSSALNRGWHRQAELRSSLSLATSSSSSLVRGYWHPCPQEHLHRSEVLSHLLFFIFPSSLEQPRLAACPHLRSLPPIPPPVSFHLMPALGDSACPGRSATEAFLSLVRGGGTTPKKLWWKKSREKSASVTLSSMQFRKLKEKRKKKISGKNLVLKTSIRDRKLFQKINPPKSDDKLKITGKDKNAKRFFFN